MHSVSAVRRLYLNLIDALSEWSLERLKLPTLGIIQEVQNRPNGDVGITRVVGSTAPVYVTEWTTGRNIRNAKDALVSLTNLPRWQFDFPIRDLEVWEHSKHSATNGQT